jgi:hypothetical protein
MRICLFLDPLRCLRWHLWLAKALSDRRDCAIVVEFAATKIPLPRACTLAFEMERLIFGLEREGAMDLVSEVEVTRCCHASSSVGRELDLVIDLAGQQEELPACRRILTPLFNSLPTELAALSSLLDERAVLIEVHDSADPAGSLHARPALSDRRILTKALDNVLSCATELVLKGLGAVPAAFALDQTAEPRRRRRPPERTFTADTVAHLARVLAWKSWSFLRQIISGGNSWAVAWRFDHSASLIHDGKARFTILPDDRRRYYADPFPYCHGGRRFLFVEEYQFAAQRGCISVASIEPDGSVSVPRPIIEEAHHLSFPFVFEHDGEIWMIPESGAANRIDLYRADCFPYVWKREGTLLDGIAAYDATLSRQGGRFWIFACLGRWKTSTWDNLCLFHAKSLTGLWMPCATNPVLLDAAASRPAGALFRRNGETFRPAQDCSQIYGGAITICRLDLLSASTFRQRVTGRIQSNALGCHTYNRNSGLEVLDVFGVFHGSKHITASYTPLPADQPREVAA